MASGPSATNSYTMHETLLIIYKILLIAQKYVGYYFPLPDRDEGLRAGMFNDSFKRQLSIMGYLLILQFVFLDGRDDSEYKNGLYWGIEERNGVSTGVLAAREAFLTRGFDPHFRESGFSQWFFIVAINCLYELLKMLGANLLLRAFNDLVEDRVVEASGENYALVRRFIAEPDRAADAEFDRLYQAHSARVDTRVEAKRTWDCPITLSLMEDPVRISYRDRGVIVHFSFERRALREYWSGVMNRLRVLYNGTGLINPATNTPLRDVSELRIESDVVLRDAILAELRRLSGVVAAPAARRDARVLHRRGGRGGHAPALQQ